MTGPDLTQADVLRLFHVDADAGRLVWREPPKNHTRMLGKDAGAVRPHHAGACYCVVKIGRKAYRRGRLIFLAVHGHWPTPCVDHANGDSMDDRIANLREATVMQNAWNHKRRKKASSLPMGVKKMGPGRYNARIGFKGKQLSLGVYRTPEAAAAVYRAKRGELYGTFA